MALIQVNFLSQSLFRTVPMHVILPIDRYDIADGHSLAQPPFQTLYLLHGLLGNYIDWVTGTRVQRWAEERNLAVVMPSGDNAFYVDQPDTRNAYSKFIGEELVDITRRMFPLSHRREDTFIGGLSMGGFGAILNGLKYNDTFSHIIGLSSALHLFDAQEEDAAVSKAFIEALFGPISEAAKSDNNPRVLIENLHRRGARLPKIYLACGVDDGLMPVNRTYRQLFMDNGFDVTWYEGPGAHEWDFWDTQLRRAMDWLPLRVQAGAINSGHVTASEEQE